ncbi:MAG: hypothetical protein N3B21_14545 [Clostridia bacterium]|nr:hypothetical protein [Clostridia bacterium]
MSQNQNNHSQQKALDGKNELRMANERRIEAMLEINDKYIRTQRHLEQHSDITNLDNLKHSLEVQHEREERMENLKNIIAYGIHEEVDERKNLKRNLEFTDHYLQHHAAHMDEDTLNRTMEKQEHRREQLKFLD